MLHNWCILEEDADEEAFEEIIVQSLRNDISHGKPASSIVGRRRACGGRNTKRNMLKNVIGTLPSIVQVPTWQTEFFSFKLQSFPLKVQMHMLQFDDRIHFGFHFVFPFFPISIHFSKGLFDLLDNKLLS